MLELLSKIDWSPTIGDPTWVGWLTVFAYFLCGYKSYNVLRSSERIFKTPIQRQKLLWLSITLIMIFLGINKQLDLQSFFTASARVLAKEYGWYAERRLYQTSFIIALTILGLAAITAMLGLYYKVLRMHALAITGLFALIIFILIRASSFHNVDSFLSSRLLGLKMNGLLELSGIALVMINARKLLRKRRPLIDISIQ